ncbi:NUDIX domain-containing protein [Paenibacillus sp. GCM10012303]|uniref:NUDIX hydrolase n=1 Tax=Paenibacillus sp. GCM10012303 TaxID=3317340 RepID=UPI00362295DC
MNEFIRYTILFIRQGSRILLLNRNSAPAKGLWNGVGGKLEAGETPMAGVLREAWEETGIRLTEVAYKGVVSWESDVSPRGGMHVFTAELPPSLAYPTPVQMEEGLLDWKEIEWVLSDHNFGMGEIIPRYLRTVLEDDSCYVHHCVFQQHKVIAYERRQMEPVLAGTVTRKGC